MSGNYKKFHTFLVSGDSYICQDGQGGLKGHYKSLQFCDINLCENECTKDFRCNGFDFTTNCKNDSCRLYQTNNAITEVGDDKRKYCEKAEGKIQC